AEKIVHKSNIIFLGNGDIKSLDQAQTFSKKYNLDGVLIGRACLGNPWLFSNTSPTMNVMKKTMLRHAELVMQFRPDLQLMPLRKHLAWYCKGFVGAAEIRNKLTKVTTIHDLQNILTSISL
ncbi:MAG: tRNA-dihydrouridine synthase, partial [bacterium]|nr:tRNA-dihydrouridine synthase [bacterium]